MPTTTSPPSHVEARRADVREQVLDAAWELAREEGLVGMSLRKLAAAVGMRAPSLYEYFDSKDAIYDGMFVRGYEEFEAAMAQVAAPTTDPADDDAPGDGGPRELLAAGARAFVSFCNDDTVRFQLLFQHAIPGWHPSEAAWEVALRVYGRMTAQFAAVGLTDPAAVDTWTAITTGLASQQVANDPGGDRWLRLVDDVAEMFLAHHLPDA